ncbi:MAG: electron transfer flavoprotein subunit alpha/FixB family protein [Desulforhopalus sp.]
MNKTGIVIEIENSAVKETSLGVMAAAAGSEVYALLFDKDVRTVKDKLAEYGAAYIINITASDDLQCSPDLQAEALAEVMSEYNLDTILGTASGKGKDLFARLGARLDEPLVSDCVEIDIAEKTVIKPHFSGKTLARLRVTSPVLLCTIRPNSYDPVIAPGAGEILEFVSNTPDPGLIKIVETQKAGKGKVDLIEASIIVTGGRAVKSAENFSMIEACAEKIGAAVGASRGAVDAGYAHHTKQVGQTGKTVSPRLYIACGVSGAIQHFVGMKTSQVIVAINEDVDAPIFTKCDYGIVGDIFDIVPALTEKL